MEDSECRENNDGIRVGDPQTQLELTNTKIIGQRDHGLMVSTGARVTAVKCDFRDNARGAMSGLPRKSSGRASLTLEDCGLGENRVFGVGACTQSELILTRCVFDGTDKTNVYKERNAIVRLDAEASPSPTPAPSPSASPEGSVSPSPEEKPAEASPTPSPRSRSKNRRARSRRDEEEAARILRRIFRPPWGG